MVTAILRCKDRRLQLGLKLSMIADSDSSDDTMIPNFASQASPDSGLLGDVFPDSKRSTSTNLTLARDDTGGFPKPLICLMCPLLVRLTKSESVLDGLDALLIVTTSSG